MKYPPHRNSGACYLSDGCTFAEKEQERKGNEMSQKIAEASERWLATTVLLERNNRSSIDILSKKSSRSWRLLVSAEPVSFTAAIS